jgi:predicted amidophosphoribosyltransferase
MVLIDKETAYIELSEYYHHTTFIQHLALSEALDRVLPVVDAVPVRHGKWVEEGRCLVCSCCGKAYTLAETNYCWQCGAKMEVDDETD